MKELRLPIAAITDEYSLTDLEQAAGLMQTTGMTGAELRVVYGKNIMDLTDAEIDQATATLKAHGIQVIGIASPILKCVLPGGPAIDPRFQQDTFNAKHTFDDHVVWFESVIWVYRTDQLLRNFCGARSSRYRDIHQGADKTKPQA